MNTKLEAVRSWSRFEGIVPLVSLPTVLLPHVGAPFQLKETAARDAVRAAVREDSLICLRGAAGLAFTPDPAPELATLAKVIAFEDREDETIVVMKGLIRAEFTAAHSTETTLVHALAICDDYPTDSSVDRSELRKRILERLAAGCPPLTDHDMLSPAIEQILPLGTLCDVLADVAGLPEGTLRAVLQEQNVDRRCQLVLERTARRQRGQASISSVVHCN